MIMVQEDKLYSLVVKIAQRIVKEDSEDVNSLLSKVAHYVVKVVEEEAAEDENESSQPNQELIYDGMKTGINIIEIKVLKSFKGLKSLRGIDELPDLLTAQNIADCLGISRGMVYTLFTINPQYGGIPFFSIGTSKRVTKSNFVTWLKVRKETSGWDKNRNFVITRPWET